LRPARSAQPSVFAPVFGGRFRILARSSPERLVPATTWPMPDQESRHR
jgi:hypothetical protein